MVDYFAKAIVSQPVSGPTMSRQEHNFEQQVKKIEAVIK